MPAHGFEAVAQPAVAVDVGDPAVLERREDLFHPDQHARQSHLRQAARALERDQHDLVDAGMPVLLRPFAEMAAANQPGFVVVRAEIGGAGMRHFDRDERDVGLAILGRHNRRDVLVGLELNHEIDFFAHQDIRVPLRDLRVVPVVHRDQLDPFLRRGALQAGRDLLRELIIGALRRVAEPERLLFERPQVRTIQILAYLLDHAAALERVQQAERHTLRQPAPCRHLTERQRLAGGPERRQEARRVDDGLDQVAVAIRRSPAGVRAHRALVTGIARRKFVSPDAGRRIVQCNIHPVKRRWRNRLFAAFSARFQSPRVL